MLNDHDGWGPYADTRPNEQGSLRWYLQTVWQRRWMVLAIAAVCTLGAALYALKAHKVYKAQAQVLVTPVPSQQSAVLDLGLITQGSDPTTVITTASLLIDNPNVAAQVAQNLHLSDSPQALLADISVDPVANTSLVSITASSGSPARAQQLANAFAAAAVQVRTRQLYQALDPAIANLRRRMAAITGPAANSAAQPLYDQLATLETLRSGPDPELRQSAPAAMPTSPSSPRTKLDVAAGLVAGLLLGIAATLAFSAIDPGKARERRLAATGLPVLTRVPLLGRSSRRRPAFDESFRSLRTMLRYASPDNAITSVAVTSTAEQEGKTTTAFQLAMATLEAGQSVVLVEADPFRPGLRSLVDFEDRPAGPGLLEYLAGACELDEVVESTSVPGLMFVPAGARPPMSVTRLLETERGRSLARDLADLADVVILDCPPVGPRSDAVLVASQADAVLIVVDARRSDERAALDGLERLRRAGARVLGIVLNRDTSTGASYEYRERSGRGLSRSRVLLRR